jgi:hypothetical protein
MNSIDQLAPSPSCTAFSHESRVASGSYVAVAISLKEHLRNNAEASALIFDDNSGKQIDFDLRGTDQEIEDRIRKQFSLAKDGVPRPVGRPRLGVVSREITLMPHHWEWLAEQPGGASVVLRRLVEDARRTGPGEKALRRKVHERTYHFMSAMAGNLANFEEASRALFADNVGALKRLIADWPSDVRKHVIHLMATN